MMTEELKAATGEIKCTKCGSTSIIKYGKARGKHKQKQKFYCKSCLSFFSA